jgi:hypothetical protein
MTYPVDDKGNPRVDFVWGNIPMQPDDQREDETVQLISPNVDQNRGWSGTEVYLSDTLYETLSVPLSKGDQSYDANWQDPDFRYVEISADSHTIATTGWSNYPGYIPNYSGDDDTGLETVVPNLRDLPISSFFGTLAEAGLGYVQTNSYDGATTSNDGKFKSQSPAAGAIVNRNSNVIVTFFAAPTVPNLIGADAEGADNLLTDVNLVSGTVTSTAVGATVSNDGTVKTQGTAAGTKVNDGTAVNYVLYAAPTVPDVLGLTESAAEASLIANNLVKGTVTTSGDGATEENDGTVKSQSPVSGGKENTGSAVDLELYLYTP